MQTKALVMGLVAVIGCGGGSGEDVPSCQQAVEHYYGAGCVLRDAQGNTFSSDQVTSNCKNLLATVPSDACGDALDDLRVCFGGVPSPAGGNADCDCSVEQDAILSCDN